MAKEVKVKKMVIQLGDKSVDLTIDEAKELHAALAELFEEKVRYISSPSVVIERPYRRPHYPWVWWGSRTSWEASTGTKFSLTGNDVQCRLSS